MFSSSVRRVALKAPPTPIASSISGAAPRKVVSKAISYRCHQRRFSSSKPSSSSKAAPPSKPPTPADDGSKGIQENPAVAQTSTKSENSHAKKKKAGEVAAKSTVKGRDASMLHLPSVPSTQHLDLEKIKIASLFALHRPISVTQSFPKSVTDEEFASIFTNRPQSNKKHLEVDKTLSDTVKYLDNMTGRMKTLKLEPQQKEQWDDETCEIRTGITADMILRAEKEQAEIQHLDSIRDEPANNLPWKYRPFNVPPPPEPMNTAESLAAGAEAANEHEPLYKVYTAVLTVEESTHSNGEVTYMAHSSPLVEEQSPETPAFRERMRNRQMQYREQRFGDLQVHAVKGDMLAISVKRIRKLKMKKHKYKKLMRRTRNLRRRLDRN